MDLCLKILQFKHYSILGKVSLLAGCISNSIEYKPVNYVSDCLVMSRDSDCLSSFLSTLYRIQSGEQTEMAPTEHPAFTLQLQEQSTFSSWIHSLCRENREKVSKWPKGVNEKKSPTHTKKDQQELKDPPVLKQSYELQFLCSTLHIVCRKGKVMGSQLYLWATELLYYPSLQAAAEKKKLVRYRI